MNEYEYLLFRESRKREREMMTQPIRMIPRGKNEKGERTFSVEVNGETVLKEVSRAEAEQEMNDQSEKLVEENHGDSDSIQST